MVSTVDRLVFLPYRLIRPPLAMIDEHAIKKLPVGNPVRELYHAGLKLADGIARVDRPRSAESERPSGGVDDEPDDRATAADEVDEVDEVDEQAQEQRRQEFEAKVDQVTRSNHSPAKMARELAMVRAAEEAREHEVAEAQAGEPAD